MHFPGIHTPVRYTAVRSPGVHTHVAAAVHSDWHTVPLTPVCVFVCVFVCVCERERDCVSERKREKEREREKARESGRKRERERERERKRENARERERECVCMCVGERKREVHNATHYSMLHDAATHCNTLQHSAKIHTQPTDCLRETDA